MRCGEDIGSGESIQGRGEGLITTGTGGFLGCLVIIGGVMEIECGRAPLSLSFWRERHMLEHALTAPRGAEGET